MSVRPTMTGRDSDPIEDPDELDDETRAEGGGVTKRRIGPLLGRRRQNLDRDGHIESDRVDHYREDGHKIRRVVIESDLTALEGAASSTTSNLEVLRLEARQAAEADTTEITTMNPHIPSNDNVLETVIEAIEREGLVPAWEVVDGPAEVSGR